MNALIVYDSQYGNTGKIAEAIAAGIDNCQADILPVEKATAESLRGVGLFIIGSPTVKYKPTPAIMAFIENVPDDVIEEMAVAAFDTRMPETGLKKKFFRMMADTGGFAATVIADLLIKKGAVLIRPPEGFLLEGEEGPLKEGETERASAWAHLACRQ